MAEQSLHRPLLASEVPAWDFETEVAIVGFGATGACAAIEAANERAAGAERRALREIEQERTGRAVAERQLEGVRTKLAETERQSQAKALEFVTANTRLNAELEAAKATVKNVAASLEAQGLQLQVAQQHASQFKAEADTLRRLVDKFKPPAPVKAARNSGKSR